MLFRTRYNVLFRQFRLLTAQAGSIPAAIRLIFENCYKLNNILYIHTLDCRSGICGILCEFWSFICIEILCSLHILPLCK